MFPFSLKLKKYKMTDKRVKWLTVHGLTSAHIVGAELGGRTES